MNSLIDLFGLMAENIWLYGGAFILVLSVLVFVHEFGHYWVARMCGVKINSFSIGFGPELFGITDRRGTRWKFSLVPLGGYVQMFGDIDPASAGHAEGVAEGDIVRPLTAEERKVAFYSQPVGRRAAIVFAGPAINFIFAILVLTGLYATFGQPVTPPIGAAVIVGSAADKAGFQPHDQVVYIDGKRIYRFEDIRREVLVGLDTTRVVAVKRGDETIDISVSPTREIQEDRFGFKHANGLLGLISPGNAIRIDDIRVIDGKKIATPEEARAALRDRLDTTFRLQLDRGKELNDVLVHPMAKHNAELGDALIISDSADEIFVRHGLLAALFSAVNETWNIVTSTLQAIWQIITGTRSATELGGLIRIGALAGDMAKAGIVALITFSALLSINLGLINLFPIPMLDGGHLLFYGIETLKGSPISEAVQEYAFRLGLVMLVGIMVFANLNDIMQLIL